MSWHNLGTGEKNQHGCMDVSENRGFYSKTDGEKNGKPYFLMR